MAYWREIKDHGYKSVFTNSWLIHRRNRSWIKGWGKNPQKSELVHCWQCLLSRATEPWTHGLRETIVCIHVSPHNGTPRVMCWHGSRPKHTQIGMCVQTLSHRRSNKKLRVYTVSDANCKFFFVHPNLSKIHQDIITYDVRLKGHTLYCVFDFYKVFFLSAL